MCSRFWVLTQSHRQPDSGLHSDKISYKVVDMYGALIYFFVQEPYLLKSLIIEDINGTSIIRIYSMNIPRLNLHINNQHITMRVVYPSCVVLCKYDLGVLHSKQHWGSF